MTYKVLVFDGVCVLCSRWMAFVLRHDHREQFRFAAMQSDRGRQLMVQHGIDPDDPMSLLLIDGERPYTDTEAIARVLRSLGGIWVLPSFAIRIVPRVLRDPLYRWIARHRYRMFGKRDTCLVPGADVADRFLS